MKKFAVLLMFLFSACTLANSYSVSGEDSYGRSLEGTIYSSSGSQSVHGELYDENGNYYDFDGYWNGYKHISGGLDDGSDVDLHTY